MFTGFVPSQEFNVFISYSHEAATISTVTTLKLRLEQEHLSVFVAKENLDPGDRWRSEITCAVKTCKAFVCVLTKRYMRSMFCHAELYEAEARDKSMFPVVCEKGWEDVPGGAPVTEIVNEVQRASLDTETDMEKLIQAIKSQSVHSHSVTVPT